MSSFLTPSSEAYLIDWGLTLAMGGGLCAIFGLLCGWIIWRNARNLTERVEERNRAALSDYEKSSDEVSRLKSELSAGDT